MQAPDAFMHSGVISVSTAQCCRGQTPTVQTKRNACCSRELCGSLVRTEGARSIWRHVQQWRTLLLRKAWNDRHPLK